MPLSEPTQQTAPSRFSLLNVVALALPLLVVLFATFAYQYWQALQVRRALGPLDYHPFLRSAADTPLSLGPGLTDANGDLIADPPPPEKQLDPPVLVFATTDADTAPWQVLREAIRRRTGRAVEVRRQPVADRHRFAALRAGTVHLMEVNTGAVPAAVNAGGFVPLVAAADAAGHFQSRLEFIVPSDSPYRSLADFQSACAVARAGRRELPKLALGHLHSLSSFQAPLVLFWQQFGMLPGHDFDFTYTGSQKALVKGICAEPPRFALAPVASDCLAGMVARGEVPAERFRSISSSAPFPGACIGCTHALKPALREAIVQALLDLRIPGSSLEKKYRGRGRVKFVRVDYRRDWAPARAIAEQMRQLAELP